MLSLRFKALGYGSRRLSALRLYIPTGRLPMTTEDRQQKDNRVVYKANERIEKQRRMK
jgi:hypothetical protein